MAAFPFARSVAPKRRQTGLRASLKEMLARVDKVVSDYRLTFPP